MGLGKDGYFHLYDIASHKPNFAILLSGRNAGKSYAVYMDEEIDGIGGHLLHAFQTGKPTIGYIRRRKEDIVGYLVEQDFDDKLKAIEELTNGKYNAVVVQEGKIFFAYNDGEKVYRGTPFAYIFCLSTSGRYKSRQYPTVEACIFEEFIDEDGRYLADEPSKLDSIRSSIFRDREGITYLIGNTISRENPYFQEWSLINVPRMAIGQIDTYTMDEGIKICVELSPNRGDKSKKMFFGRTAASINNSAWDSHSYPHLTGDFIEDYEVIYSVIWKKQLFAYIIQLLIHKASGNMLVYVRPAKPNKNYRNYVRIEPWSDDAEPYLSTPFMRRSVPAEEQLCRLIAENKVCFSTNLTGEDFNVSMKNDPVKPFLCR